jgi:hypothetical protein
MRLYPKKISLVTIGATLNHFKFKSKDLPSKHLMYDSAPIQHTLIQSNPIQLNSHNLRYHNFPHLNF